jgi:hypothetical protein
MSFTKSIQGSTLSFSGNVTNLESNSFHGYVLGFVTENSLVDPNYPTITWNFVFRGYCLNQTSDLSGLATKTFSGTWTIPMGINATNIQVILAVYNTDTRDPTSGLPYAVQSTSASNAPVAPDVAVTNVSLSKTVVGQGYNATVNVTVANQGNSTETFNVTLYANAIVILIQKVTNLGVASQTTFSSSWNTTGFAYGNYTISAYAWPVPGETNTANNNFTDGLVNVVVPGDVDGNGKVNMGDISTLCDGFGSTVGADGNYWHHPPGILDPFSPNLDIDGNGKIDMGDIVTALGNFGRHYP